MLNELDSIFQYQPLWGKWKIDELIGQGNFGRVYRVSHEEYGHTYLSAVKMISIPSEDQYNAAQSIIKDKQVTIRNYFLEMVQSLVNEVNILYSLSGNSNILGYHDHKIIEHPKNIGWDILIRMEYVKSLGQYLTEKQLSRAEIATLGIDICTALDICSKHGIIHRDIKDDNIFYNDDGIFKLGDFGIAMKLSRDGWMTSMSGTPHFMAPEVYRGESFDASVDIYSLGIVMYRLFNHGRLPFMPPYPEPVDSRDRDEAFEKRMNGNPFPLPDQAGNDLAHVILKACSYRADDRYASPVSMKRALKNILQNMTKKSKNEWVTLITTVPAHETTSSHLEPLSQTHQ
jgi:serine/threonine protein kinase